MKDVPILMFHSINFNNINNPMNKLIVNPEIFETYIKYLYKKKYSLISMNDLLFKQPVKKPIVLTFDDGYVDNYEIVMPILKKYSAKGTIFVNPEFADLNKDQFNSTFGFLSPRQLIDLENSGILEVQSHTSHHRFIWTSSKIIDVYDREKFDKYYWLAWNLFPESITNWGENFDKYAELIPNGYPIFEFGRELSTNKFIPNQDFIQQFIEDYNSNNSRESDVQIRNFINKWNNCQCDKGNLQDYDIFINNARQNILYSKDNLEQLLNKEINIICFPGGGYNNDILQIAENIGFKAFMNSSSKRLGNNLEQLNEFKKNHLKLKMYGFNRISFNSQVSSIFGKKNTAKITAKLTLLEYEGNVIAIIIKFLLSKFNYLLKRFKGGKQ